MTFCEIFFSVAHLYIQKKLFCLYQFFISSAVQRNYGGDKKNVNFRLKMTPQAKKMTFSKFSFQLHIYLSRQNVFVFIKISYLQPFREIMWGTKNVNCRLIKSPQAEKMTFLDFSFLLHI